MTNNLISMSRHGKKLDEDVVGPIEYLLTKLSNLDFKEDPQHVKLILAIIFGEVTEDSGVIEDSENNKSTQFMFNKTTLIWRK